MKIMNKLCLILLCFLMPYSVFANVNVAENSNDAAEKAQLRKTLESHTFAELVQQARDNLQQLDENERNLTSLLNISSNKFNISDYSTPINFPTRQLIEITFNEYVDQIIFDQLIYGTQSKIRLSDINPLHKLEDYKNYGFKAPVITVTKAHFIDDSEMDVNKIDKVYTVNSNKQIISLELNVKYNVPKNPIYKLTFSNKVKTHDNISLKSIENGSVTFSMSGKVSQTILAVEGLDSQGKTLTLITNNTIIFNQDAINRKKLFYQNLLKRVNENIINDKESMIDAMVEHLLDISNNNDVTQYHFKGDVDSVNIYLKSEPVLIDYKVKNSSSQSEYINGLTIGYDNKFKKEGIINSQGEWITLPLFLSINHSIGDYYNTYINEDNKKVKATYLADIKNKKFMKQPFLIKEYSAYDNRFIIIDNVSDDVLGKGLLDIETHKILLPTIYSNIEVTDYFFLTSYQDQTDKTDRKEVFNAKNNQKIYSGHATITVYNDTYITEEKVCTLNQQNYEDCYSQYTIYNNMGKEINNKPITGINGRFSANNLLLISVNKDTFFINKQGQKLNINLSDYQNVEPFSENLAAVQCRNNELYGYINETGKLVIPCIYHSANYFQGGSALVEDKQYQLIKPDNSVIRKIAEKDLYSLTENQDDSYSRYKFVKYMKDGTRNFTEYNNKGEIINENDE